jgi:hypothetical protein
MEEKEKDNYCAILRAKKLAVEKTNTMQITLKRDVVKNVVFFDEAHLYLSMRAIKSVRR